MTFRRLDATRIQPKPFDLKTPRFQTQPFPPYRHVPGITPHPRRDPEGHSRYHEDSLPQPFNPLLWRDCPEYLYGVDLYNFAYYWEAHEAWEGLWKTTGRKDSPGLFLQGLIQISAALLKREMKVWRGAEKLSQAGLAKLLQVRRRFRWYSGVDLEDHLGRLHLIFVPLTRRGWPADPRIHLALDLQERISS